MEKYLNEINNSAKKNTVDYIAQCEKRFDDDLNRAVSTFLSDNRYDIVLLAGPSSSGKTTTAGKFADKIRQSGRNAFIVSLDDFYLNRDDIPDGEDGLKDFESINALDIDLIHSTFSDLIEKRSAELPLFDFKTGSRTDKTKHINLERNDVIVVEGLHALNPVIADGLDESHLYKIYVSVSSRVIGSDGEILLNKRNLRLIRRMIRDAKHRNMRAEDTFNQWDSVLRGEDKYLFPFEPYADVKIDSFHPYESCIFKQEALTQLDTVSGESVFFKKVCEMKKIFEHIYEINSSLLPEDSLLCEFLR